MDRQGNIGVKMSTVSNYYYQVWIKSKWDLQWLLARDIEPLNCTDVMAPELPKATFRYRYGSGRWEDNYPMTNGSQIDSHLNVYIRITASTSSDFSDEFVYWAGIIPAEQLIMLGRSDSVITVDQVFTAYGLESLLKTRIDHGWVIPSPSNTPVKIGHLPVFNSRVNDGNITGNRSTIKHYVPVADLEEVSYVFSGVEDDVAPAQWSNFDIIEYLIKLSQPFAFTGTGPVFNLGYSAEIGEYLKTIIDVYDFTKMRFDQAMNMLVSRSRGLAWYVYVNIDDEVFLSIRSILDEEFTVADNTVPACLEAYKVNIDLNDEQDQAKVALSYDNGQKYDKVIVRGARFKVCGTFAYYDGTLIEGWTGGSGSEEEAYLAGASGRADYGSLTDDEKAVANDVYRAADRFDRVFSTFIVPASWDWKLAGHNANPALTPDTAEISEENASYFNVGKRFLSHLPWKEGADSNPYNVDPRWRRPFALLSDGENFFFPDKRPKKSGSVRPLSNQLGIEIKFSPNHVMAEGYWDGAEPSGYDPDEEETAVDYFWTLVTAMVETDQHVQVSNLLVENQTEALRTLIIDIPSAELWYVVPDTITDVDENGTGIADENGVVARDDRDTLKAILAAASAWYSKTQYKLAVVTKRIYRHALVGQMFVFDDPADDSEQLGSLITSSVTDFVTSTVTLRTDYAELDIAAAGLSLRSAPASSPTRAHTAATLGNVVAKMEQLKSSVDTIPLRPALPSAAGEGSESRKAYAKTDAGAGTTLVCYLDTDLTGEEVTVDFEITGGEHLNETIPRIETGKRIYIKADKDVAGGWSAVQTFQATVDC